MRVKRTALFSAIIFSGLTLLSTAYSNVLVSVKNVSDKPVDVALADSVGNPIPTWGSGTVRPGKTLEIDPGKANYYSAMKGYVGFYDAEHRFHLCGKRIYNDQGSLQCNSVIIQSTLSLNNKPSLTGLSSTMREEGGSTTSTLQCICEIEK